MTATEAAAQPQDWWNPYLPRILEELRYYHPGAAFDFRSMQTISSSVGARNGQQCTYDKGGLLITGGAAAGSPDLEAPYYLFDLNGLRIGKPNPLHTTKDINPWKILGWRVYGAFWRANQPVGATSNIVTPIYLVPGYPQTEGANPIPYSLTPAYFGQQYNVSITVQGMNRRTWVTRFEETTRGDLPSGLRLSVRGGIATISGTPTLVALNQSYSFALRATDTTGYVGSEAYTITVLPPVITLSQISLPSGKVGQMYPNPLITATGGKSPYKFFISGGSLPDGLVLDANGIISGIPTVAQSSSFTVIARDADNFTGSQTYTITIDPADSDTDGDGSPDNLDCSPNNPSIYPGAPEIVNDGIDQDCNGSDLVTVIDADGDGKADFMDNCPTVYNPDQANHDADELGDVCDDDIDSDNIPNNSDACPYIYSPDNSCS